MRRPRTAVVAGVVVVALALGLAVGVGFGSAAGGSGTTTGTTRTQPSVTVIPTTPTSPRTKPGYGKPTVALGDMNTPEQFIIGDLYKLALEHEGYAVTLNPNIGDSAVAQNAMRQGTLDLYPDYLDDWNTQVAGDTTQYKTLSAAYRAASVYADAHGAVLLAPTPMSDTPGIAVTSQYAAANRLHTITQLADGTGAILAVPLGLGTALMQQLDVVEATYGLVPSYTQQVQPGTQYYWLQQTGNVQAAYVDTTDPQLITTSFKLLRDPKHAFGFGNVVPVTTEAVLNAEGSVFAETIERVDSLLTTRVMRGLNAEVEVHGRSSSEVALEFLRGQGLLTPLQYAPVSTTTTGTSPTTARVDGG